MRPASQAETRALPTANPEALARVARATAYKYDVLPLTIRDGTLTIAVPEDAGAELLDYLRGTTRLKIAPLRVHRERIRERVRASYGDSAASGALQGHVVDAPAVRAVDDIFERAIRAHASDVHVEPTADGGLVRVRIDGILRELRTIDSALYPALVSRIKLIAGMDIADKRQPQDGRSTIGYEQRDIDARVSSVPTIDGEKLVIRLLDQHAQSPDLARLGMPTGLLAAYRAMLGSPWGFIVVAGPTGSGKTTTLYGSLAALDATSRHVCSVEDPVEMRVSGVSQVQINPRAGVTFATVLRCFMRQDPNVIMVGEMRDAETAAVAVSASLAGQLVFTTLHANDAPRSVERLVELGVARHSLAAGITAVIAQRLVRRLCEICRNQEAIPANVRARHAFPHDRWYAAAGCRSCDGTGYIGRTGLYELLVVDDPLRDAIAGGASSVQIAQLGKASGYRPMLADGLEKVLAGETSFAELTRVVAGAALA
ncbi:MAG: GspE/PulE family protein [Candidatus Velthaea sp.]